MIVIYKGNAGSFRPLVLPLHLNDSEGAMDAVASTEYCTELPGYLLAKGAEYRVYGLLMYCGETRCLIVDSDHIPGFFPLDVFQIKDSNLLCDWSYGRYFVWGSYLEVFGEQTFVQSYDQIVALIDGKPEAIRDFLDYQAYVQKFW